MALLLACGGVLLALLSSLVALGARQRPTLLKFVAFPLLGAAGLAALTAGGWTLALGQVGTLQLPLGLPWLPWQIRLDALAGLFLALIGAIVAIVALYGPGYMREFQHGGHSLAALGGFTGLFVAGMLLVVLADDAFLFMIAWELMSLASYFLVVFQHEQAASRRAGFLYLLMAHVGGLAILLGFGVLASFGGGFGFDAMRGAELPLFWASIAFGLGFLGFGMKAGLVPLHVWLPDAHPAAPSHISALMSGVMLKVAIYGFVRLTFDLLGEVHWGWGVAALLIGSLSAVLGVLYALMQNDLKRLLAYSSIENVGIVFIGLGLAIVFRAAGHPILAALGLVAALFHAFNHGLFKSLLFLTAGAILQRSHERDLERMGGLARRMPYTAVFALVGCLSIASLPPFNGFASEWLTFQTALQGAVLDNGLLRILIPVSAAMLALTGALAAACFVKAYGVAFLGQPRSRRVRHAREVDWGMRSAQGVLAAFCLLLGIFPSAAVALLGRIPELLFGLPLPTPARDWLWLSPTAPVGASYSAPLVWVGIALAVGLAYLVFQRLGPRTLRRAPAWDCGFGPLTARMQYTSTAFAMPIRRIFQPLWRVDERVERSPLTKGSRHIALRHELHLEDRSWRLLYEPLGRWVLGAARRVTRLQTGSLRLYLAYSFFTLLLLLWLIS